MALKYRIPFSDLKGFDHEVEIFDKNYSGSTVTELTAGSPPVSISYKGNRDKFDPIIGSECELNILVTSELDPFFGREFVSVEEDQYTVEVKLFKSDLFWTGFILPDRYQEEYLFQPYEIKLRATDSIARLNDRPYGGDQSIARGNTRNDESFFTLFDIIQETLRTYAAPIYTDPNSFKPENNIIEILDFYEENQISDYSTLQQTLVNSNALFKEGEENNVGELEPKDAIEVVEGILKAMGCRMYQSPMRNLGITDTRWIIERVNAIYHNRASFNFVDHRNSAGGSFPRSELFNVVEDSKNNFPTRQRDKTYQPAFDLNKLSTFTEESNAGREPNNAILLTNESEPTVEFLPARPDARVKFSKDYKKQGNQTDDIYGDGKMAGYLADPFFSLVRYQTSGNYAFANNPGWQPSSTPVPAKNINNGGSSYSPGIAIKTGSPSIYSTSPRKGNTKSDGTSILVDGRTIRVKYKAKLINDQQAVKNAGGVTSQGKVLLPFGSNSGYPGIKIRVDAGGDTYQAVVNSNNQLVFTKTSVLIYNETGMKFDEANEFLYEIDLPNVGERGTISVELFDPRETNIGQTVDPDTFAVYNHFQIEDVKDQDTDIRTYDGVNGVDTSVGRYEKEVRFGDAGFPAKNGLKYINNTSVSNSDRFKALSITTNWKAEPTIGDEQPLLKSLTRQYMRNLRRPSFILSAELWWGNLDADPFHLFLDEATANSGTRTFTLMGQSLEMDIANRRLDGQWIQNLEEQESPGFLDPGPGTGVPSPGFGDGPAPQPAPPDQELPDPGGTDFVREITRNGFVLERFDYRVLVKACQLPSSANPTGNNIFLPNVNNIQCNQVYQITVVCTNCSSKTIKVETNPNDSAEIAGNSTNSIQLQCGESAEFVKSCSTGDWIRVS